MKLRNRLMKITFDPQIAVKTGDFGDAIGGELRWFGKAVPFNLQAGGQRRIALDHLHLDPAKCQRDRKRGLEQRDMVEAHDICGDQHARTTLGGSLGSFPGRWLPTAQRGARGRDQGGVR
mgnify:CR=1 FL=1